MVQRVGENGVAGPQQRGEQPQISLVTGREEERRLTRDERRQRRLDLAVKLGFAAQQARAGRTDGAAPQRREKPTAQHRIGREAEVVVRR